MHWQDDIASHLINEISNYADGDTPKEEAKANVMKLSAEVKSDDDWNYITGEIDNFIGKHHRGIPTRRTSTHSYKSTEHQAWLNIQDKEREDRCAQMRRKAAQELGITKFP